MNKAKSHVNHSKLEFSERVGTASVNVYTGKVLFERADLSTGSNSYALSVSHIFDNEADENTETFVGKGWKLNIQQYLKLTDEKDDNGEYLYEYSDIGGYKYYFEKYITDGTIKKYFDREGSGMTLYVSDESTYIEDSQGNIMEFKYIGNVYMLSALVSAINSDIKQVIEHDSSGKVLSVYDKRKPQRKIDFEYENNKLVKMVRPDGHETIFTYGETGELMSVNEYADAKKRYTAVFRYENGLLAYAADVTDNSTIKLSYDKLKRVTGISTGLMKTEFVYSDARYAVFPCDTAFCGTGKYCGQQEREFLGYRLSADDEDFEQEYDSSVDYREFYTIVKNSKGVEYIYFFNGKGFTSGILEYVSKNKYKTLFKQTGVGLDVQGDGESINGSRSAHVNSEYSFSENNKETFKNYTKKEINKKTYDYLLSFWVKLGEKQENEVKANLYAEYGVFEFDPSSEDTAGYTDESIAGSALLDHTAKGGWQYVSIPFNIQGKTEISYNNSTDGEVDSVKLLRYIDISRLTLDGAEHGARIADIHISTGNLPKMKICDAENEDKYVILDKLEKVKYKTLSGATTEKSIGKDFFMTESDVISTGMDMCRAKASTQNSGTSFVLTCNAGTKRISKVTEISFIAEGITVSPGVNSENDSYYTGNPVIYTPTIFQATEPSSGDDRTYTYISYAYGANATKPVYIRTHTYAVKYPDDAAKNKESHEYEWKDAYGRDMKKRDAYGVISQTEYDEFGNVVKTTVYTDSVDERIEETYSYDEDGETLIGTANGISGGAIHTEAQTDPIKQLTTSVTQRNFGALGANRQEFSYNEFGDELREVKLVADNKTFGRNTLEFNKAGQLAFVSPSDNCRYEIRYDRFGNATEFRLGNALLLSKKYDYDHNKITAAYHRSATETDELETEYDAFGRVRGTKVNGVKTLDIVYEDETADYEESAYCADIKRMTDHCTGETYTYDYDAYTGKPTKYAVSADGKEVMSVKCIGNNKIQYNFDTAFIDYEDEILYDEECLISPRVNKISNNNIFGMEWEFGYDELGRYSHRKDTSLRYKHPELDITYKRGTYLKEKITYSDSINETIEHTYDERGNVTHTKDTYLNKVTDTAYTYDPVNRLIKEVNGANGITREYTYDEEGNIATVKEGDNVETCVYNAGRLVRVKNGERTTENYSYDTYGNPTYYKSDTRNMWWERGTQLKKYGNETFVYDMQNKLHKRTANGRTHRMYYDGDKLIAMEIGNKILRFFYDLEGIAGFKEGTDNLYTYIKDGQGNVIGLANDYGMKARYVYDAWGQCAVTDEYGDEITAWDNAAMLNPIRWKSQYYDNDSGLYYIGNRWYDPKRGRYISAASPEELLQNAGIVFALNLYLLVISNPVAMMLACGSIEPSLDFYYDGEYKTWWDVWGKWMFLGIGVLATIVACAFSGGCGVGLVVAIGMTLAKIAAATVMGTVISLAIGGVIAGIQSALTGHGFWQGFAENVQGNFVDTLITSFTMAAVTVMLGNIIKVKQCFKEGTLVATEEGLKPIEEIREGDRVLAYDEVTGEQGYKPVVQLFRNETNSWCTVSVKRESDGEVCEITSTPGHKYYLPENERYRDYGKRMENISYASLSEKWVSAESLKCGDKVLLSDGTYGIIQSVKVSLLAVPETTYNFEVADYHTYYVGENSVCVHNANCVLKPETKEWNKAVKDIKNTAQKKGKLNYTVKDKATAERLMKESGLQFKGEGYIHDDVLKYVSGFEQHIADNVVNLPHFKFWNGRVNGHVYWLSG